ncbi:hypothetical protein CERZMDRAFT_91649 [Cercospora zeae-maydis SCOH1-5]|uniref:Hydrophobin n=1 Tax=Cercospora zeae-maydis SCOH1-5 TaxID=717836 RepID=A0A6A6F2V1_9PEZI|nr:hypothetical protein CERZMDRAFT_91649 [Cercospora zeae-maydis SCOH1-5]
MKLSALFASLAWVSGSYAVFCCLDVGEEANAVTCSDGLSTSCVRLVRVLPSSCYCLCLCLFLLAMNSH